MPVSTIRSYSARVPYSNLRETIPYDGRWFSLDRSALPPSSKLGSLATVVVGTSILNTSKKEALNLFVLREMATQVYLRVFSIKSIGADHLRRFPKGKISVTAELGNSKASTAQCHFGTGSVKVDEVSASIVLKFKCSRLQSSN